MRPGILFDFDGTLADTFADIVETVHRLRSRLGAPGLSDDEIRRHIGWGSPNLLWQCNPGLDHLRPDQLPPEGEPPGFSETEAAEFKQIFLEEYEALLASSSQTRLYDGITQVCASLVDKGAVLAIVSNKTERITRRLMATLGLADYFALILGGDSLATKKPAPEQLLYTIRELALTPERTIMVGDSQLDVIAAQRAGLASCGVTWGLIPESDLRESKPTFLVRSVDALESVLTKAAGL